MMPLSSRARVKPLMTLVQQNPSNGIVLHSLTTEELDLSAINLYLRKIPFKKVVKHKVLCVSLINKITMDFL